MTPRAMLETKREQPWRVVKAAHSRASSRGAGCCAEARGPLPPPVFRNLRRQLAPDLDDDPIPIAYRGLAENSRRGIPRIRRAILQPAPAGVVGVTTRSVQNRTLSENRRRPQCHRWL